MKFRKKPVVIEAVRFEGSHASAADAIDWMLSKNPNLYQVERRPSIAYPGATWGIEIPTPEGVMTATPGDWIIRGVKGEFYPCKDDIFRQTYEPMTGDD